jgi:hypothetical protein
MSVTAPPGQCNAQVVYTTPTATDNCALLSLYLQSGLASYSTFPQGVTTNIWRATDDSGVTKTCVFTVTVACGTGPSGISNIEYRTPNSEHRISNIEYRTPNTEHRTPNNGQRITDNGQRITDNGQRITDNG